MYSQIRHPFAGADSGPYPGSHVVVGSSFGLPRIGSGLPPATYLGSEMFTRKRSRKIIILSKNSNTLGMHRYYE